MSNGRMAPLAGATLYEFKMQWRRWVMWLPVVVAAALMLIFVSGQRITFYDSFSEEAAVGTFALLFNFLTPIACGLVLADRLPRDGRLRVDEMLESLPVPRGVRLWGKTIGVALATMVPWLLVETFGFVLLALHKHALSVLFLGLGAFLTVNLPALIVTAALCVALPALVWPPVYRFLFLAFWFWAGLDPSRIPSISSTLFAPAGGYAAQGLFAGQGAYAGLANSQLDFGLFAPPPSLMTAVISIALLLTLAAGIVCLGPVLVAVARREN